MSRKAFSSSSLLGSACWKWKYNINGHNDNMKIVIYLVANMDIKYWSVGLSSRRGWKPATSFTLLEYMIMVLEYNIWILWQGENCQIFRLLIWTSFIGQLVHPVGEEDIGYMGWIGMAVIWVSYKFHFIRVHDNLM